MASLPLTTLSLARERGRMTILQAPSTQVIITAANPIKSRLGMTEREKGKKKERKTTTICPQTPTLLIQKRAHTQKVSVAFGL